MGKNTDKQEVRTRIHSDSLAILDKWCNRKGLNRAAVLQLMIDFFDSEYESSLSFKRRIESGRIVVKCQEVKP